MKVHQHIAPTSWAPLLINGDASGMEAKDIECAEAWLGLIGLGGPVDCEDAGFRSFYWPGLGYYFADCSLYTVLDTSKES